MHAILPLRLKQQKESSKHPVMMHLIFSPPQSLGAHLMRDYRAALLHDGLRLFQSSVKRLTSDETDMITPDVTCADSEMSYQQGESLLQQIEKVGLAHALVRVGVYECVCVKGGVFPLRTHTYAHAEPLVVGLRP